MTYQHYPGQQPFPPAPYPGYGTQPPKPSGVTAIIAGVLAVLGGAYYFLGLISVVVAMADAGFLLWLNVLILIQNAVIGGLLLAGGILLFLRKPAGRPLTIIGCGLAILMEVVSVVLDLLGVWEYIFGFFGMYLGGAIVAVAIVVLPAVATLVLTIVKPTARWCARPTPAIGYAPR